VSNNKIDWDFITDQIYHKKFTPVISNQVINDTLFGDNNIIRAWADKINYPLADGDNLTRVAQFLSVTQQDIGRAKSSYLQFLKRSLLEQAKAEPAANPAFLEQVQTESRGLTFSQLATERLHYPDFKKEPDNPLSLLAALDIPIYITTSHHHFVEAALRATDKTPRTELYYWQEGLEGNIPPNYRTNLDFEPTVKTPLVYHLHGIDDYPDSLVITEDDYMEFLVNVTRDFTKVEDLPIIPSVVRNALSNSLLLLLGYDLHAWDLRVLLQGIIKGKPRRPRSYTIQLVTSNVQQVKDAEQFHTYLREYFDQIKFDVYWGEPQTFMKTLWEKWEQG
jgi:hypothetical protein